VLKIDTLNCRNLRVEEDSSKEENSGNEVGNWAKSSRIRKPVPPPAAEEDLRFVFSF